MMSDEIQNHIKTKSKPEVGALGMYSMYVCMWKPSSGFYSSKQQQCTGIEKTNEGQSHHSQ